jgi:hypothetical protein
MNSSSAGLPEARTAPTRAFFGPSEEPQSPPFFGMLILGGTIALRKAPLVRIPKRDTPDSFHRIRELSALVTSASNAARPATWYRIVHRARESASALLEVSAAAKLQRCVPDSRSRLDCELALPCHSLHDLARNKATERLRHDSGVAEAGRLS